MGPYLSQPKRDKNTVTGEGKSVMFVASEMQGIPLLMKVGEIQWKMHISINQI